MSKESTTNHHYDIGIAPAYSPLVLVVCLCLFCFAQPVCAAVEVFGDVDPANPATWTSSTDGYIGKTGSGTLNITDSDAVSNRIGYIGFSSGSTGKVTVDGHGTTWTNNGSLSIGGWGKGTLNITAGGAVSSNSGSIGAQSGSTGEVTVDGAGSAWTNSNNLYVAGPGRSGTLNITNGGVVSNSSGYIGGLITEVTVVTVDGSGSEWSNRNLTIGSYGTDMGNGLLNITGDGLVSIAGSLTIFENVDGFKDGFINMATGGMLALNGQADGSLADFFGLIDGTDAIRYWNDSISDWADITGATYGHDYTLTYITEGNLDGYTMLTVPEPATLLLLGAGGLLLRRKWKA